MADSEKSTRTRLLEYAGVKEKVKRRVYYSALPADSGLPAVTVQEVTAVPAAVMGNRYAMRSNATRAPMTRACSRSWA